MTRLSSPLRPVSSISRIAASLAIVFAFIFSSVLPAFALGGVTGNVNGSVVDATKMGVRGASITLSSPSGTYRATSDANGKFSIVGISVDSYTLTVEAQGFESTQELGVSVQGDQSLTLPAVVLTKNLRTIGKVRTRSASSAFQPSQTTDSYTVSGARVGEVQGKAANINEQQLLLAVPGATLTNGGNITVRGGLSNETGYQLDGVPFTEPFFGTNASNNRINGLSSLQVIEGAGDATQGNIGSGVVNIVPKRGTYPGTGLFDTEIGGPNYDHQIGIEYGIASKSGNVSNYFSYIGERDAPYYGYANQNVAYGVTGNGNNPYLSGTSYRASDNIIDNFVVKFGKGNAQSLQVLYNTLDLQQYGQLGGLPGRSYYLNDPYTQNFGVVGNPFSGATATAAGDAGVFAAYAPLTPYADLSGKRASQDIETGFNPTSLLKFEYDNNLDDKTFLALRYYNFNAAVGSNSTFNSAAEPVVSVTGGQRVGEILELTRTLGRHTLTFQGQLENQKPRWNDYDPELGLLGPLISGDGPALTDFLPATYNAGIAAANGGGPTGDGWVYQHIGASRVPSFGINYNGADFQTLGAGLRDQWNVTDRLKLDFGVRVDHANYKFGRNPYNPNDLGNPSDVPPSFITDKMLHPTEIQPRIALAFQPSTSDGIRLSYGRSVEFLNSQDAGTPMSLNGADALFNVPVTPGSNTANPATWTCGSGLNPVHIVAGGANKTVNGGGLFRCQNYAQQYYWALDKNLDAPDLGNGTSPTYSNYDASYSHQFQNGFGIKATGFYRLSTGLPGFFVLSQMTDPSTGEILSQVFSVNNNAIQRTTGAEFEVTTPERPVGFSGYLSATYQNAISSVPPLLPGEDALPLVTSASFALGDTYRAGFLSPFSFNLGGQYRTRGGLTISPSVQFNAGYPIGVGNLVAYNGLINGLPYNVVQSNLGSSQPTANGYQNASAGQVASNYVDPALPGSILNPNIAATRGVKEKSAAGGLLTNPYFTANIGAEYKVGKHNTVGVYVQNLTGQIYAGHVPVPNTYYQPVTTGVAGPATGIPRQSNPALTQYANHGYTAIPNSSYGQSPFLLFPNRPTSYRLYYQLGL